MFKKHPNVKNLSVLRSSDRKKIVQQIIQQYHLQDVDVELKNILLPDGAQSAKFTTHLDEPGVLYYDSQGVDPLWIKVIPPGQQTETLIPSVYTMWQVPSLLKTVSTWDHVISKLQGGADLMTPGLTGWNREIKAGEVVAVALQNRVPLAVGVAAFDVGNLSKAVGQKGKAVYIVHCFKDELWALGKKSQPPAEVPISTEELDEATQQLALDSEDDEVEKRVEDIPETTVATEPVEETVAPEPAGLPEPSVSEIDNAFKSAAIYGLFQLKSTDTQNTITFPLTSSTFVSTHLMPYLPEPYSEYTFKKTSYKKAATFLKKYMEKEGLIKTKDRSGEPVIQSINWNHKLIVEFKPYPLEQKKVEKTVKEGSTTIPTTMVQVRDLYKATGKVLRYILESQHKSKDELYSASQVREILSAYLTQNPDLIDPRNPRLIKIDYNLTPLLKPTESHIISLPRDKLLERLLDSSSSYYTISTGTETQTRKGKPPKIHIVLEKRQGRKTVTRFSGLEAFFINPNELAEELRNTCATSASVGGLLGSSPKQPVMEVMIQGPQATAVIEALEKRGVKKTFILLEDKRK